MADTPAVDVVLVAVIPVAMEDIRVDTALVADTLAAGIPVDTLALAATDPQWGTGRLLWDIRRCRPTATAGWVEDTTITPAAAAACSPCWGCCWPCCG